MCFVVVLWAAGPTGAGERRPTGEPQTLWKAFPLNPTNEPLVTLQAPSLALAPKRPPVARETSDSGSSLVLSLLAYTASALLVLSALGLIALRMHARTSRRTLVLSQVVVGFHPDDGVTPRFIPDIETRVRGRRGRRRVIVGLARQPLGVRLLPATWAVRRRVRAVLRLAHDLRIRARRALRNEEVRAAVIGTAAALVLAYFIAQTFS